MYEYMSARTCASKSIFTRFLGKYTCVRLAYSKIFLARWNCQPANRIVARQNGIGSLNWVGGSCNKVVPKQTETQASSLLEQRNPVHVLSKLAHFASFFLSANSTTAIPEQENAHFTYQREVTSPYCPPS